MLWCSGPVWVLAVLSYPADDPAESSQGTLLAANWHPFPSSPARDHISASTTLVLLNFNVLK